MRERVNNYVGFGFIGAFSVMIGVIVVHAIQSLPMGIPPPGGF